MQQGLWVMGEPQAVRDPLPPIWDTLYLCKSYVGLPFLRAGTPTPILSIGWDAADLGCCLLGRSWSGQKWNDWVLSRTHAW